jgi:transcriptional regulator with XRE-family HTH domain
MARQAREDKGWSQAYVAKKLKAKGIDNMHPTTVAKLEAGDREVKLDEAAALADLYGKSLDAMLGKGMPDERSLTFALVNVSSYAGMAAPSNSHCHADRR